MPPTVDRAKRDEHDSAHKTPEEVTTKSAIHSPIVSNSRITLVGFYLLLSFKPLQDMMSTNTEDATRRTNARKRYRRTDDDEPDAAHGSLASSSDAVNRPPSSSIVQGTRLEPIMDILESQPTELKGTTISLLNEMLDLRATIKQRVSTHA